MSILKISLPISLQEFVDQRVRTEGYESDGDYVCDLSRKDRGRQQLRGLLLDGMRSAPKDAVGHAYFKALKSRFRE